MSTRARFHPGGSTLIVTLSTLAALSLMAALTFTRVAPRFRMSHQNAAWEEARLAAEAGVDVAMGDLLRNSASPTGGSWQGWQQKDGTPVTTPGVLGGVVGATLGLVTGLLSLLLGGGGGATPAPAPSTGMVTTGPVYLDNLRVSSSTGVPTEIDVQLWSLQPNGSSGACWFRIRSRATCALPPTARNIPANLDASLRRFSLQKVRPSLQRDDPGKPTTIPLPNISRTVEVIVEPVLPFELALCAARNVSLCPVGSWCVDSYDSHDPLKSGAGGLYPGKTSPLVQENGHVATSQTRPATSRYGPLIAANGARVRGFVATQGGDDPSTPAHENVSGDAGLDPARIRDDFCRELNPIPRPAGSPLPAPHSGPFLAGSASAPSHYEVTGNLGNFRVAAAPGEPRSYIVIMIDGDLTLTKPLIVPPTVSIILHVRGNIAINNNANSGPWNSGLPGQLIIIGESDPAVHRTLQATGNSVIAAAFYGPTYVVTLDGDVDWRGSIAAYDFQVRSGGDGGLHYDEALATLGPAISYRIARYVEDVRE